MTEGTLYLAPLPCTASLAVSCVPVSLTFPGPAPWRPAFCRRDAAVRTQRASARSLLASEPRAPAPSLS